MKSLNMQSETIQKWKENTGNQKLYSETREFGGQSDQSRFEKSDQHRSVQRCEQCDPAYTVHLSVKPDKLAGDQL